MKKQRVFQEGLVYVFTMKKFKKDLPKYDKCPNSRKEVKEIWKSNNGMEVVEFLEGWGTMFPKQWCELKNGDNVHIDWCKCIGKEQTK